MREELRAIMAKVFKTDINNISDNLNQKEVEFWDSLRHLTLIIELEQKYDVSFEPEEISEMISFEKVFLFLNKKVKPND
jgi:acyl carrier protein